ncbi:flavohemoprotein [Metarhizium album ARSEF 1941]|uniref:Flavohemoprotein n=1 Tax=Metarhizium album (strain ARSEF 1941) TaxID=1081103 RepID=A0A0B2WWZ6_METAS|nr:flavohemoprotein [Metarhizium album ARSEF 1941]KHN97390.1 flavohemoprotein [Metarhizium album ARSEF 1941]
MEAFTGVLDPSMTPGAKMAWNSAYWALANMFIAREKQLYATFGSWTRWRPFGIVDRVYDDQDVLSFHLEPRDGGPLPPFVPGQYVSVRVATLGKEHRQIGQYALREAPNPDYYRITRAPRPLSTGIGASPMLSILNFAAEEQPGRPVSWINASPGPMPFQPRIDSLAVAKKNLRRTTLGLAHGGHASPDCEGQQDARLDFLSLKRDDLFLGNECTEYLTVAEY